MNCKYTPCGRKARADGYCPGHYMQARRNKPLAPLQQPAGERPSRPKLQVRVSDKAADVLATLARTSGKPAATIAGQLLDSALLARLAPPQKPK